MQDITPQLDCVEASLYKTCKNHELMNVYDFIHGWAFYYMNNPKTRSNVLSMSLEAISDALEGRPTTGNYHDNQCIIHGMVTTSFIGRIK